MDARRYPVRAVLFDLDGTLLDTIADLAEAANRMLTELNRPQRSNEEIETFVGKGIPHLVRRCMTEGCEASEAQIGEAVERFRAHYADVNGTRSRVYPGVSATLDALRQSGMPMAVVTNKAEAFTRPLLARMGIDHYFAAVVSGDTLPVKKPDPAVLQHACKLLAIEPAQAIMIGDSANDAEAARGAGMPVLLVTYGYSEGKPVDMIDCDGLLSSATEALDRLMLD